MCWTARPTLALADVGSAEIARHFPTTELAFIGDEIADGVWSARRRTSRGRWRCSTALRTDFSLARLTHYTGTPAEHVQQYILFTNYHRYVDEFVRWGCEQLQGRAGPTRRCPAAGNVMVDRRDRRSRARRCTAAPGASTRCRPTT